MTSPESPPAEAPDDPETALSDTDQVDVPYLLETSSTTELIFVLITFVLMIIIVGLALYLA